LVSNLLTKNVLDEVIPERVMHIRCL
jgi:hypothetical protein